MTSPENDPAAAIARQLRAGGLALPVQFVEDVVEKSIQVVALRPELDRPSERPALVRRVASALYEDQVVIGRIVDQLYLALDGSLIPLPPPPPAATPEPELVPEPVAEPMPEPIAELEDEDEDSDDADVEMILASLEEAGVPATLDLVGRVMDRYLDPVVLGESLRERGREPAVVARIAADLGEDEALVGPIVAELRFLFGHSQGVAAPAAPVAPAVDTGVALAVAERLRGVGIPATPIDVEAVMQGLAAPSADSTWRPDAERVAMATGRPASLVALIIDELARR